MEANELRKTLPKTAAAVERIMEDPAARYKLKLALDGFLKMDPNDALADARTLVEVLGLAANEAAGVKPSGEPTSLWEVRVERHEAITRARWIHVEATSNADAAAKALAKATRPVFWRPEDTVMTRCDGYPPTVTKTMLAQVQVRE